MKAIYLLLGALVAVQVVSGSKPVILDQEEEFDVDYVAKKVCWSESGSRNQISRFSTIKKLIDYLMALPAEHELSSCAKHHVEPLVELWHLLNTLNDDLCSQNKIRLIEDFHYFHVAEAYRVRPIDLPKVLRVFFGQYASQVNTLCAASSHRFFAQNLNSTHNVGVPETDRFLKEYVRNLGMKEQLSSYDDMYLIWNFVNGLPKKTHAKLSEYLISGPKRLVLRIWDAKNLRQVQQVCSKAVKPLYSQTLLPIMQLADLGYYPASHDFLDQIRDEPFVNRLYKLALLCETLLPIGALEADPADEHQCYLMKPAQVERSQLEEEIETAPQVVERVSMDGEPRLALGSPEEAYKQASRIKSNVAARKRVAAKMVAFIQKNMKRNPYKKTKLWGTDESLEAIVKEMGDKVSQSEALSSPRHKRSLKSMVRNVVLFFQNLVFMLVLGVFFVINSILWVLACIPAQFFALFNAIRGGFQQLESLLLGSLAKDWVPASWGEHTPKYKHILVEKKDDSFPPSHRQHLQVGHRRFN